MHKKLVSHKVYYQVSDQQGEQREASDHTWPENQNDYGLLTRNTESWDSMRGGKHISFHILDEEKDF